jgi:hypothetical protein
VPDPGVDALRLLERARRQSEARQAAAAELLAAGSVHRSRLSRAARDLLLDKLSGLFAAVSSGETVAEHRDTDLGLLLRATRTPGTATVVAGDDGTITIDDLTLVAVPLGAVGRGTGLAAIA